MKMTNFSQVPWAWYGLINECDLSMEDINLLSVINSLNQTRTGCIASDDYLTGILKVPNIRFNIQRLQKANLIQVNNGKVRKIIVNKAALDKL